MHCYIFSCTLSTSGALICSCHWTMHTFHYIFLFILKHSESGKSSLTEIAFQKLRNTKPGLIRKRNLHNIFTPFSNIFAKLHERWLDFCSRRNQFWIWILHILFFGKCKTILIRPLKHSIHYFLNIFFLSSICLLLIFFFVLWFEHVCDETYPSRFVCHIKKKLKEPIDQHFCAGLLVLGKAQKYTPVLKNYCIIIRLAKWHIRADVDFLNQCLFSSNVDTMSVPWFAVTFWQKYCNT